MPDLDKILPLILIALWYIFKGKKKPKKAVSENYAEDQQSEQEPQNRAPKGKATSLQDILEELMGEEKAKKAPSFQQQAPPVVKKQAPPEKKPVERSVKPRVQAESDKRKAEELAKLIRSYDAQNTGDDSMDLDEEDFNLREAIIHQVILERPYKD
jgi:hypothetical protein